MALSTILFDYGGTLDSSGLTWLDRFFPLYLKQGLEASQEAFAKAFYSSDDNLASRFTVDGLGLEETLRLQVQGVLQTLAPERMELAERIVQPFLYECRDNFRKIRPTLTRLKESYSLAVVSNFYGNLSDILRSEDLLPFFSAVSDSGKVGFSKPAPEIFLHAMNELGSGPSNTWMVGDSLTRDMKGAEMLGLSHVWLRGEGQQAALPCCAQVRIINGLQELEASLGSTCLA
jgi:putative hydrolase of the HAD superfamily